MRDARFKTLFLPVILGAVLLVLPGCRHGPLPSDLGSTEANACRSPKEPGCNPSCCIPQSNGTCHVMTWAPGTPEASAGVEPWFNASEARATCPTDCRPCARCTRRHELEIQWLGERPECDCTKPTGVDPCIDPSSCECYCESRNRLAQHCPDLVPHRDAPRDEAR